jgi:hypothetical protein
MVSPAAVISAVALSASAMAISSRASSTSVVVVARRSTRMLCVWTSATAVSRRVNLGLGRYCKALGERAGQVGKGCLNQGNC